jgi:hypothetical protein
VHVVLADPGGQEDLGGILEFFKGRDMLFVQVIGGPGPMDLPITDRQRTLIDFEELLGRVLHERYGLPDSDQVTAAVWARASIGAIRTTLGVLAGTRTAEGLPKGSFTAALSLYFAALPGENPPPTAPDPADADC